MNEAALHDLLESSRSSSGAAQPEAKVDDRPTSKNPKPDAAEGTATAAGQKTADDSGDPKEPSIKELMDRLDGVTAGLKEERKKRQQRDLTIAELRGRLDAGPVAPQKPPSKEEDDFDWTDPKGSIRKLYAKERAAEKAAEWQARANASEARAFAKYDDYLSLVEDFKVLVAQPGKRHLAKAATEHEDPAEFIVQTVKASKTPKRTEEEIRAEIEAKVRAELAAEGKGDPAGPNEGPKPKDSLARAQSARPPAPQSSYIPLSKEELLKAASVQGY